MIHLRSFFSRIFVTGFFLLGTISAFGQANTNCAGMDPICTNVGLNFPAGTAGGSAQAGNNYDCLLSTPNPAWHYLEVATNGNIDMQLSAPSDIDFIIWGPFPNLAAAQANCGGLGYGGTSGNVIDCSFSASATEYPSIPGAVAGQVYIMLITNFSGAAQNIVLQQTGGTGSTDCSIVNPCNLDYFEANISACNPATNTFGISGVVQYSNPPTTGQLIVEDCNGNQQVFNPPFGSSVNYAISGITADGAPCDISVYFTADNACSQTISYTNPAPCTPSCDITGMNYSISACNPVDNSFTMSGQVSFTDAPTSGQLIVEDCNGNQQTFNAPFTSPISYSITANSGGTTNCDLTAYFTADLACSMTIGPFDYPANCVCVADAGTYTTSTTGSTTSTGPFELCFNDILNITSNLDSILPEDFNVAGVTYDPGIFLAVYNCPPTVAPPASLLSDPCLIGVVTIDGAWSILNNVGDGSTMYYVPLTMYSMVDLVYAISINGGDYCYDLGPVYQVTYLEEIIALVTEDCQAGTATAQISGGTPAFDASQFSVVPGSLSPATASFVNTTAANNGSITITGLVDGDAYSFEVVDANNCPVTITGTFVGPEDASFSYPQSAYCKDEPNPSPVITGVSGGTFSAPAGVSINSSTGVINLSGSTTGGPYSIVYTSPDPVCFSSDTFEITINPLPIVDGNDETICVGESVTLNGTGADTYVWDAPVVNGVPFSPATTTTYNVVGTITATGCSGTGNATVTVNPLDDPSFTTTDFCVGAPSPAATVSGTAGGTFSFNPLPSGSETINASTGSIANGQGGTTYTIQYTTSGACPDSATQTVTVFNLPVVDVPDYDVCVGGTIALTATGANNYTWSPGTYLNTTSGSTVSSTPVVDIQYTVTGTDLNGCQNTDVSNVTILPNAPINAGPDVAICEGETVTLTASGGVIYNWQAPISASGASQSVSPSVTTTYIVDGEDAQGCLGQDEVTVTVNPLPTASITGDATICEGDPSVSVVFTGANGTAPYTFTYTLNNGQNQTITSSGNTASITVSSSVPGTFVYNLIEVEDASSTLCSQAQSGTATIVVNPSPTATISGTVEVCEGEVEPTITFTGSGGVAPYTFTYTINGGTNQTVVSTSSSATLTVPTNTSGTYTYTLVSVQDASSTSCSQSQTGSATVTVNPIPTASISGSTVICVGDINPVVTFTGANGTAPYTFTYNVNGGANQTISSNGTTATVSVPTNISGTFDYNLVGVVDASSTSCSQSLMETVSVQINPLPTATISGDVEVCLGDTPPEVVFTGANGTAPYTFTYTINGGNTSTVTSSGNTAAITIPTNVPGAVMINLVSVEDASTSGCLQNQSGSVTVIVHDLPIVSAGSDFVSCEGEAITLSGSGANTYSWNNGVQDGVSFTPSATMTYTVTGVDLNGCENTDEITVTVEDLPEVIFVADVFSGCEPLTVTFTNLTGGNLVDCIWNLSDGTVLVGCGSVTTTFANGGLYDVTLTTTSANGCTNSETYQNYIYVEDTPVASFSSSSASLSVLDTEVQFDNSSTGAVNYLWNFGDESPGSSAVNPSHVFPNEEQGNYVVQLIAMSSLGCADTAYQVIVVKDELIYYVPNTFTPDADDFNETFKPVFSSGFDPFNYSMFIYNRWGEIIWESHDASVGWDGTYGGTYHVQDGTYTWKMEFKTTMNDKRVMVTGHVNVVR